MNIKYKVEVWKKSIYPANKNEKELEKLINDYGDDGWELINIIPQIFMGSTSCNVLVFKKIV